MAGTTTSTKSPDHPLRLSGAALGLLVFVGGIVILVSVFLTARSLFETPPPPLPLAPTISAPATPADPRSTASVAPAIAQSLVDFAKQLLLLLLMCIAGSVIASRGIEMFFKACAAAPHRPGPPQTGSPSASPAGGSATTAASVP